MIPPAQTRKPLVEKKRRARINESLQDLRVIVADTDVSLYTRLLYQIRVDGLNSWTHYRTLFV